MSLPLTLAALWVIAGTAVALLPMRFRYPPGILLLAAAPCLLVWIGLTHGPWIAFAGVLGFVSMFRHPLRYFLGLWFGPGTETSK